MTQIQQGDALLKSIDSIPKTAKRLKAKNGKHVLAEGEVTNHAHVIDARTANMFALDGRMFLDVKKEASVTHEEHGAVKLSPGKYEVKRVREYDYFSKMVAPVRD